MKIKIFGKFILLCFACLLWLGIASCSQVNATSIPSQATDLPTTKQAETYFSSWNDPENNETVQTIINFVEGLSLPAEDRVAVFDNDGTLWGEFPYYYQAFFLDPDGDGEVDLHLGETTDDYIVAAHTFATTENNPAFETPYVDLIYKPMVELLDYLRANDFQVYICSGGEIDFIRGFAEEYYGIPPENIIGSTFTTTFDETNAVLKRASTPVEPINDGPGKAVGIERYIGKKPILAGGNSNGDFQMMQYTDDGPGPSPSLMLLLRHDDLDREQYEEQDTGVDCSLNDDGNPDNDVDDGPGTYCHINKAVDEVNSQDDWHFISVKNDFTKVFLGSDPLP